MFVMAEGTGGGGQWAASILGSWKVSCGAAAVAEKGQVPPEKAKHVEEKENHREHEPFDWCLI